MRVRPGSHEPAWALVDRAEDVLDRPLRSLLLDASAEELRSTAASQLSVLLASLMAWEAVAPVLPEPPVAMAGHSLGQVTALLASGVVERGRRAAVRGRPRRRDATGGRRPSGCDGGACSARQRSRRPKRALPRRTPVGWPTSTPPARS